MQLPAFPPFPSAHIDDMEQNMNTAMMIADGDYDDICTIIPENTHAHVWRLQAIWEHEQNKNIHFLHICKTFINQWLSYFEIYINE